MATQEALQQLQFQVDHAREECNYLRRYIVLTRMLRRAEDDLTAAVDYTSKGALVYTTAQITHLRALRHRLVIKMIYKLQLNEVLDDYESKIEQELQHVAV